MSLFDTIEIKNYGTPGGYWYKIVYGLLSIVKPTSFLSIIIKVNLFMQIYFNSDLKNRKINYCIGDDDLLIIIFNNLFTDFIDNLKMRSVSWKFKFLIDK